MSLRVRNRFTFPTAIIHLVVFFLPSHLTFSQVAPTYKDVVYATVDGKDLKLDIYLPTGVSTPILLVWVHGGAWRNGTKASVPKIFVENGIATASLDFRQSTEARFPAAIYDIKAAIRFLRAKASMYGYRIDKIAIGGDSSGGHLATLVGVSSGNTELEGTLGSYANQSSRIHAILDYYGATNLSTILAQSTPFGLNVRKPALELLLGSLPESAVDLSKLASPVNHIDKNDPPLLMFHGDQDPQMPINQSHELQGQYQKLNLDVHLEVIHGAAHGGNVFYSGEQSKLALDFLKRTMK